jgi:hypothetical protein
MGDEAQILPVERAHPFERRLARTTLVLGGIAAAAVAAFHSSPAGIGVLIGTLLAWVNFRWMEQAVDAVATLAVAQSGAPRPRISSWTYAKFFARYALIGLVVYGIVSRSSVPAVSLLGGLLALGAAAMVEGLRDVWKGTKSSG